jgi:hypothetical protein
MDSYPGTTSVVPIPASHPTAFSRCKLSAGAKGQVKSKAFAARPKSCPDTKPTVCPFKADHQRPFGSSEVVIAELTASDRQAAKNCKSGEKAKIE